MNIKEAIQKLVEDGQGEVYSVLATVVSVDENARTITAQPINESAEIPNVRLQAAKGQITGLILIPKVDSQVVVSFLSKEVAFVSLCVDVDKVLLNCEEIVFNDGNNGGATNTPVLRTELNKTIARITALEVAIAAYASAQGTAAASLPVFAPLIPALSAFAASVGALPLQGAYNTNIEDTKVKH